MIYYILISKIKKKKCIEKLKNLKILHNYIRLRYVLADLMLKIIHNINLT